MNNNIFLVIALSILIILISGCSGQEAYIKEEIEKANYCNSKEDCNKIKSQCPFGCNVYVNSLEKDRIQNLIDSFNSKCVYKCMMLNDVECNDNKCKPIEIQDECSSDSDCRIITSYVPPEKPEEITRYDPPEILISCRSKLYQIDQETENIKEYNEYTSEKCICNSGKCKFKN